MTLAGIFKFHSKFFQHCKQETTRSTVRCYCARFSLGWQKELSPCIMCVQYRGGVSVPWGVFSTVGGYHEYLGGYLEYRGGVQYRGGYHDKCGGYLEYRGGCSVPWRYHEYRGGYLEYCGDIMMHVGDIMSTVEGVQYRGGKSLLLFEYPTVLNTPTVLMISPHMHHDIQIRYSNFKGLYPPRY